MKFLTSQKKMVNGCAVRTESYITFRSKAKDRLGIQLGRLRVPKLSIHTKEEKWPWSQLQQQQQQQQLHQFPNQRLIVNIKSLKIQKTSPQVQARSIAKTKTATK